MTSLKGLQSAAEKAQMLRRNGSIVTNLLLQPIRKLEENSYRRKHPQRSMSSFSKAAFNGSSAIYMEKCERL